MSSIRADMQLNAAPFLAGIARVQTSMRNLQAAAAGITGAFFAVRSTMAGLSAVFEGMKGALDMGGKFSGLSAATGASVSELVLLSKAFENNGLAADAVGPMIARFQKALAGLNEDGQSTTGVLQKLGVNTLALNQMSVAAQFQELSRAFSAIEDPAERTRRAMELFGRSGAQMLTLFRDPDAFTRAAAEIGSMGDVLEDNATKFDSMSDAITTLGQKMDQFFVGAMSSFTGGSALEDAAKVDFTTMGQSAGAATAALSQMFSPLQKIGDFVTTKVPYFTQIRQAIEGMVGPIDAAAKAATIDRQTKLQTSGFDPRVRSVSNEEDRAAVMDDLGAAIEAARARMENLDTEFASVPEVDRVKILDALGRQIGMLDRQRTILSQITPEVMAANAAEADRAAALAKSAAEAAKLAAQVDKALEGRDAEIEKRIINELPPEQAQQRVLQQVSAPDKQAELILGVTGLQDIESAKAALDAFSSRVEAEMQLRTVGMGNAEDMIKMLDAASGKTDGVSDKTITMALQATGAANIEELRARLEAAPDEKTIEMILRATGTENVDEAKAKLASIQNGTAGITITSEGVTAEIERLRDLGGNATDMEKARLMELIEAEKTLLGIKERQTQEDEKRATQAERISQLMGDLALDADKVLAQAAGDTARVQQIDTQKAANELQRRFESEGMDSTAAAELARAKAEADMANQAAANVAQIQPQQGDAQRSIGLGGSAGLGPSIDVQKEIARKQEAANRILSEIKTIMSQRQVVRVAEVFD